MVREVLRAYVARNAEAARATRERDTQLDALYTRLFSELLTCMGEDAPSITACTHLLFIAKNLERIGDHATNIAEEIWFLINAEPLKASRKGGTPSPAMSPPPIG
jgi:phosphate transport system protein